MMAVRKQHVCGKKKDRNSQKRNKSSNTISQNEVILMAKLCLEMYMKKHFVSMEDYPMLHFEWCTSISMYDYNTFRLANLLGNIEHKNNFKQLPYIVYKLLILHWTSCMISYRECTVSFSAVNAWVIRQPTFHKVLKYMAKLP